MSEANKATAITFIEAFSDGDADRTQTCLAQAVKITAKGVGKLSGVRSYDVILATTAAFKDIIPTGLRPKFISVIAEGDRVVVEFEGNAKLSNGEDYCNEYCLLFTFENGLILHVHEYYCTILADDKILPLLASVEEQRHAAEVP